MPEELGARFNQPYLIGVYLAINAIPDVSLLVDGPGCIFAKARRIHGTHDLGSTLLSCDGRHRIHYTGADLISIASDFEEQIVDGLRLTAEQPCCQAVLLSSLPLCTITGTDYSRLIREAESGLHKPIFHVPGRSLSDDWLGGYAAVLEALAEGIDLEGGRQEAGNVAIVGYFMDRTEGDHRGNITELKRMLRALSLNPCSIWLSNEPYEALREVRHAGTIISLPHGRRAAKILAQRLEARLVEADLPFGLEGTRRWIDEVARPHDRTGEAEGFIHRELGAVIPRLEWVVPQVFLNRKFAFMGDPCYATAFVDLVEELGGSVRGMFLAGREMNPSGAESERSPMSPTPFFLPREPDLGGAWKIVEEAGVDLLVANTEALELFRPSVPWIEWGYPSHHTHFLAEEPFLGFKGCLAFVTRLANEITRSSFDSIQKATD